MVTGKAQVQSIYSSGIALPTECIEATVFIPSPRIIEMALE
jgi:hypothetical protein